MHRENGLYLTAAENWKGMLPARIEWLFKDKLKPDAFFCIDNKPIVLFYDSPQNKTELFQAIWNFNESPVIIINEPNVVEIFNGFSFLKDKNELEKLGDEHKLNAFSYFELVTGKTWQIYANKLKYQHRVDYKLLENIKTARELLVNEYHLDNSLSNALIGKCIFIRYLIDRNVRINFDGELRAWTNNELCQLLENKNQAIQFLNYLKDQFNGEAFLLEDSHLINIPQDAFDVLSRLMRGTELATDQMSLFDIYDFSIIPVEFISNVYEHFIGSENQAKKGAYYTPLFLVDYIVTETVGKFLAENPEAYNCKVLDPACGSGIFLVEALRSMIESYQNIYKITATKTQNFKDVLRKIAEVNLYGIDQDPNAINVAIFSIYLALLDYQEPKEIENFRFPKLLNKNFFTNDFFDPQADFNNILKNINFHFILGNPPWKRGSDQNALFLKYIQERKKDESEKANGKPLPTISNKEIAQAFVLRTSDFSTPQTKCALIVTSKTLYNLNARDFRKYFLHHYFIDKVLELAPVRREVFDKSNDPSVAPPAIIFFHHAHGAITDKNIIQHLALKPNRFFSLFKIFMLQRDDCKQVAQSRLKEFDWLWKLLVYGGYLDFNLIMRLKKGYETISDIINNNDLFLFGQGIMVGGGDLNDVSYLLNQIYLDTRTDITQFCINLNHNNKWEHKYAHRPKNIKLFNAPILLITEGINKKLESKSAISYENCIFKSSLTGIKLIDSKKLNVLKTINGFLNSSLFSYYILQTGSSAGIEREQTQDEEKFNFPYSDNSTIANQIEKIEAVSKKLFEEQQKPLNPNIQSLENEKNSLINDLNDKIFNSFSLDEQERILVDYTINVTIPLIMRHQGYEQKLFSPLPFKSYFLEDYANLFFTRFKTSFREKHLEATICHTNYIVGIFFKVVPNNSTETQLIEWQIKDNHEFLKKIMSFGTEKITEQLFIQKDIRGFEKDGFYIIKPNEKKLWHQAIGYPDVEEFADAILKAGSEAYHG